jgi:hypothetical protein
MGTIIPSARRGIQFIDHHFEPDELLNILEQSGLGCFQIRRMEVQSQTALGNTFETLNVWGQKY